jgi:hypothetical protein
MLWYQPDPVQLKDLQISRRWKYHGFQFILSILDRTS